MIKGLYQQLEKSNAMHARASSAMRDGDPQTSHDAGVLASRIEAEIKDIKGLIGSDLQLVSLLDEVISSFGPTLSTPNRMLALRHVEDAQSRLIRELGDYPPMDILARKNHGGDPAGYSLGHAADYPAANQTP